jgi:hydroxymethylglutaryl-CoA lyase
MGMPSSVTITDVALRDGLQNHPRIVPTDRKLSLLQRLLDAGVVSLEVGSFVHPKLVPAMADTEEVHRRLPPAGDARLIVLVPNLKGARRALAAGAREVRVVLSATEGHSRSNTNRSVAEGLEESRQVLELLRAEGGAHVVAALATTFVCPFDGVVPLEHVRSVVASLVGMGFGEVCLSDTLGRADPAQVERTVAAVRDDHPGTTFSLHVHDTYGMGLANVVAGLRQGVTGFDSALGGIGGCPFAPGAAGNVATEDVVFMLQAMGIDTGIHLDALAVAAAELHDALGTPLESSVSRALGWVA